MLPLTTLPASHRLHLLISCHYVQGTLLDAEIIIITKTNPQGGHSHRPPRENNPVLPKLHVAMSRDLLLVGITGQTAHLDNPNQTARGCRVLLCPQRPARQTPAQLSLGEQSWGW